MRSSVPLFRGVLVKPALAIVRESGHDPAPLLARAQLPADTEQQTERALSLDAYSTLLEDAAELAREPLLGIKSAARLRTGTFGLFDYLARSAPTPRAVFEALKRFSTLYSEPYAFTFEGRGDLVILSCRIPGEPDVRGRQRNEALFALVLATIPAGLPSFTPELVRFEHAEHDARALVADALIVRELAFGADSNEMWMSRAVLDVPLSSGDPVLHDLLTGFAEQSAIAIRRQGPFVGRIKDIMRSQMRDQLPTLASGADAYGASSRSLQRLLGAAGTSFNAILDSVREQLARGYLRRPEPPIYDVALLLHYAEVTAFTRAFRRWTGTTPGQFRGSGGDSSDS